MKPRSIPPRTSISIGVRGAGFNKGIRSGENAGSQQTPRLNTFKKMHKPKPSHRLKVHQMEEVYLEVFEESKNELKVIGEFPGIEDSNDLIIQIENQKLDIVSKPGTEKKYEASVDLPDGLNVSVKKKEVRNGIIVLILGRNSHETLNKGNRKYDQ